MTTPDEADGLSDLVIGVSSEAHDGTHALLWDWDDTHRAHAAEALYEILDATDVESACLIDAGHPDQRSWHAISPERHRLDEAERILRETPRVDGTHVRTGADLGRWILRIGPKNGRDAVTPTEWCTVRNDDPTDRRVVSEAHLQLLQRLRFGGDPIMMDCDPYDPDRLDGNTVLPTEGYRTWIAAKDDNEPNNNDHGGFAWDPDEGGDMP